VIRIFTFNVNNLNVISYWFCLVGINIEGGSVHPSFQEGERYTGTVIISNDWVPSYKVFL
jgi:hypothetical protein